jgi:soluble lytic murein transglycosylase-like protein
LKEFESYVVQERMSRMADNAKRHNTREERKRKQQLKRKAGAAALTVLVVASALVAHYKACEKTLDDPYTTAAEETIVEPTAVYLPTPEPVEEPELYHEEAMEFYPVPLDHDIQAHIIHTCRDYEIDPAIVVSIIGTESSYDQSAVGDGGDSRGLMQIQEKWHRERMDRLGVTDLLDPIQNVSVGVDYIAELLGKYPLESALTAYNSGKPGTSAYAQNVLERMEEFEDVCM